jgi:hypothetical protein
MRKAVFIATAALVLLWVGLAVFHPYARHYLKDSLRRELRFAERADWEIRLGHEATWQLAQSAHLATKHGFLVDGAKSWVSGTVVKDGRSYRVRLRLRGDLPKHWKDSKRSYRLRFLGPSPWDGQAVIDLILPEDKGDETEHVAYQLGRMLKLLVPSAGYTTVSINGVGQGSYFWKAGPSREMLAKLNRPDGAIFRENNLWFWGRRAQGAYKNMFLTEERDHTDLHLRPHLYTMSYRGQETNNESFARFAQFLEILRTGQGDLQAYLDEDAFHRWLAIVLTLGSQHATMADNVSWYLNSATGLFEPVLYDVIPARLPEKPLWFLRSKSRMIDKIVERTPPELLRRSMDAVAGHFSAALAATVQARLAAGEVTQDSTADYVRWRARQLADLVAHNQKRYEREVGP